MALCLLAFRELLQSRPGRSAGLLSLGVVLHPLMTAPACLVWAAWLGWPFLARSSPMRITVAAASGAAALLFCIPEIGYGALGFLDRNGGRCSPSERLCRSAELGCRGFRAFERNRCLCDRLDRLELPTPCFADC